MKVICGSEIELVAASHEDQSNPGVRKRVLASREDLLDGRVQMLNWAQLPSGSAFRPHYHEDMQEVFVILNGAVTITVDGTSYRLSAGDAIVVEPREVHQMRNDSNVNVEYIVFGITLDQGGQTVVV